MTKINKLFCPNVSKIYQIVLVLILIFSCSAKEEDEVPVEGDIDWPNETTQNEYFKTTTIADNEVLFSHLRGPRSRQIRNYGQ